MGRQSRSQRDGLSRKASQRSRRSAAANFGAPLPSVGGAKGSKPTIGTETRRDAPRGNDGAWVKHIHREREMLRLLNQTSAGASDARLLRFARNDVDGVFGKQP